MTSAMKEIMLAVSRTVSPWAIWLLPSSRSWTSRPSRLQAEAKEKRVRVELSRNREMPRPDSKDLGGDVVLAHIAQGVGHGEDGLELVVGLVPGQEEVALVHLFEVQGLFSLSIYFCRVASMIIGSFINLYFVICEKRSETVSARITECRCWSCRRGTGRRRQSCSPPCTDRARRRTGRRRSPDPASR